MNTRKRSEADLFHLLIWYWSSGDQGAKLAGNWLTTIGALGGPDHEYAGTMTSEDRATGSPEMDSTGGLSGTRGFGSAPAGRAGSFEAVVAAAAAGPSSGV